MRAESLIIGAYVLVDGGPMPQRVDTVETDGVWLAAEPGSDLGEWVKLPRLTPVPITTELVEQLGYRKEIYRWLLTIDGRGYQLIQSGDEWLFGRKGQNSRLTPLAGIHHYQMLMCALEGTALTLTPETTPV